MSGNVPPCTQLPDPFVNYTAGVKFRDVLRFFVPGLLLIPLRIVCILLLLPVVIILCLCTSRTYKRPPRVGVVICRLVLWCFGYWWVDVAGKPHGRQAAPIVAANHVSCIDPFFIGLTHWGSPLVAESFANNPILRPAMRALGVLPVARDCPASRAAASAAVEAHALNPSKPPLLVFPEGTTHGTHTLLKFKLGAFRPLLPVQPVVVHYEWRSADPSWARGGLGGALFRLVAHSAASAKVVVLPPIPPPPGAEELRKLLERSRAEVAVAEDAFRTEGDDAMGVGEGGGREVEGRRGGGREDSEGAGGVEGAALRYHGTLRPLPSRAAAAAAIYHTGAVGGMDDVAASAEAAAALAVDAAQRRLALVEAAREEVAAQHAAAVQACIAAALELLVRGVPAARVAAGAAAVVVGGDSYVNDEEDEVDRNVAKDGSVGGDDDAVVVLGGAPSQPPDAAGALVDSRRRSSPGPSHTALPPHSPSASAASPSAFKTTKVRVYPLHARTRAQLDGGWFFRLTRWYLAHPQWTVPRVAASYHRGTQPLPAWDGGEDVVWGKAEDGDGRDSARGSVASGLVKGEDGKGVESVHKDSRRGGEGGYEVVVVGGDVQMVAGEVQYCKVVEDRPSGRAIVDATSGAVVEYDGDASAAAVAAPPSRVVFTNAPFPMVDTPTPRSCLTVGKSVYGDSPPSSTGWVTKRSKRVATTALPHDVPSVDESFPHPPHLTKAPRVVVTAATAEDFKIGEIFSSAGLPRASGVVWYGHLTDVVEGLVDRIEAAAAAAEMAAYRAVLADEDDSEGGEGEDGGGPSATSAMHVAHASAGLPLPTPSVTTGSRASTAVGVGVGAGGGGAASGRSTAALSGRGMTVASRAVTTAGAVSTVGGVGGGGGHGSPRESAFQVDQHHTWGAMVVKDADDARGGTAATGKGSAPTMSLAAGLSAFAKVVAAAVASRTAEAAASPLRGRTGILPPVLSPFSIRPAVPTSLPRAYEAPACSVVVQSVAKSYIHARHAAAVAARKAAAKAAGHGVPERGTWEGHGCAGATTLAGVVWRAVGNVGFRRALGGLLNSGDVYADVEGARSRRTSRAASRASTPKAGRASRDASGGVCAASRKSSGVAAVVIVAPADDIYGDGAVPHGAGGSATRAEGSAEGAPPSPSHPAVRFPSSPNRSSLTAAPRDLAFRPRLSDAHLFSLGRSATWAVVALGGACGYFAKCGAFCGPSSLSSSPHSPPPTTAEGAVAALRERPLRVTFAAVAASSCVMSHVIAHPKVVTRLWGLLVRAQSPTLAATLDWLPAEDTAVAEVGAAARAVVHAAAFNSNTSPGAVAGAPGSPSDSLKGAAPLPGDGAEGGSGGTTVGVGGGELCPSLAAAAALHMDSDRAAALAFLHTGVGARIVDIAPTALQEAACEEPIAMLAVVAALFPNVILDVAAEAAAVLADRAAPLTARADPWFLRTDLMPPPLSGVGGVASSL